MSRRSRPAAGDPAAFLPTTRAACEARGWQSLDVIFVTGDAYVDHPSFAAALLGRMLEAEGLRVGVIARPDPEADDVALLGEPRLFFAIAAGAVDSMINNYTAQKRRRSDDDYAPGGRGGRRPDRATIVYANALRRLFGRGVPIVAGGLEASLRRFSHYDFWSDRVRRSIALDAPVDALVHGMGERPLLDLAAALRGQEPAAGRERIAVFADAARRTPGVVYVAAASDPAPRGFCELPSHEEVCSVPAALAEAFVQEERNRDRGAYQDCAGKRVIANPPPRPLATEEMDRLYALPFQRAAHPENRERVPALEQVQFSVTAHRGCSGGCAFCGISAHQGKAVQSRSAESVLAEVRSFARHPDFRGTVRDVGGATANLWGARCERGRACARPSCLAPRRCPHLHVDQRAYLDLLGRARAAAGVKHLFVTTGVRMDLALECPEFVAALAAHYTSGHLKVAPEHVAPEVLERMRKPEGRVFQRFLEAFGKASQAAGKEQYVLPYFIAAHPGCRMEDMIELALFLRRHSIRVEQCQLFIPIPGTAAAVMYATGMDPYTGEKVFVERHPRRREMQKALILWHLPESRKLVLEALRIAGRMDLAGTLAAGARRGPARERGRAK